MKPGRRCPLHSRDGYGRCVLAGGHSGYCEAAEGFHFLAGVNPRLNSKIVREGDRVKLVRGETVVRVGYPKTVQEFAADALKQFGDQLREIARQALPSRAGWQDSAVEKMTAELGFCIAKVSGFGGPRRSVHLTPCPQEWVGKTYLVDAIGVVGVGTRYEGHYSSPSYDEMYGDYESPYLSIEKRQRLAHLDFPTFRRVGSWGRRERYDDGCWVPVEGLEKIPDAISTSKEKK